MLATLLAEGERPLSRGSCMEEPVVGAPIEEEGTLLLSIVVVSPMLLLLLLWL